ncbi:hypothetical protein D9M70_641410 [compost metagenome]
MFRDDRLRNAGLRRQRPHGLLPVAAQPLEKGPPRRVRQRAKEDVVGFSQNPYLNGYGFLYSLMTMN